MMPPPVIVPPDLFVRLAPPRFNTALLPTAPCRLIVPKFVREEAPGRVSVPPAPIVTVPPCATRLLMVNVALVARIVPRLKTAAALMLPAPELAINSPTALVRLAALWYVPPATISVPSLTNNELLVSVPSTWTVAPVSNNELIEPPFTNVSVAAEVPATARYVPAPVAAPTKLRLPLVAVTRPALTSWLETVPNPATFAPLLLVRLPPVSTPPPSWTVPALAQSGLTVNVLAATLIVPLLTGATVSVALLLRLKLPELTKALLIAPSKNIAPVLVTRPLKYVFCDTNTVP